MILFVVSLLLVPKIIAHICLEKSADLMSLMSVAHLPKISRKLDSKRCSLFEICSATLIKR